LFDYDAPDGATQEALSPKGSLAAVTTPPIPNSASISDGRYGNEPDADGLVSGTWDNGESAICGAL
jgi:hypothetical protein